MSRITMLVLGLLLLAPLAVAQDVCPWINKATAFGILANGKLTTQSTSELTPTSCTFTYRDNGQMRTLQVIVSTEADAHEKFELGKEGCESGIQPLAGIGNEAVTCRVRREHAAQAFEALGRVRDMIFTITISTSLKNDSSLTPELASKAIAIAAGQVAGNLF